jgi:hypothetical protein
MYVLIGCENIAYVSKVKSYTSGFYFILHIHPKTSSMKKVLLAGAIALSIASCTDKSGTSSATTASADTASSKKVELAYSKQQPVDWEWGSDENTQAAMNALKAYETGNVDESMKYFADSVTLQFENMDQRMSKDSVAAMFRKSRGEMKSIRVIMDDYESVRSKDGKAEYVSFWYKQITESSAGKIDSMEVMNDIKMKDGKIVVLNEKTRHYGVKK